MIRTILIILVFVTAPVLAQAQQAKKADDHKFSIGTGLGFASSVGPASGFNWQLDAMYKLNDKVSVGSWMQVVPVTGVTLFSMTGEARYHFNIMRDNKNDFLGKLTPYAGAGMGFSTAGGFGSGFLFSMIGGVEYDINEQMALTTEMRLNVTSLADTFYFSWQLIGARYRF